MSWHQRFPGATRDSRLEDGIPARTATPSWRSTLIALTALLTIGVCAAYGFLKLLDSREESSLIRAQWTPDLQEFWRPFLSTNRPLMIVISVPLFVGLPGVGAIRDGAINREENIPSSTNIAALQKALRVPAVHPNYYWAAVGDVNTSFMLGRLLGPRVPNLSLVKSSELSWGQLSENNVVFIESQNLFTSQMNGPLPAAEELVPEDHGFTNLHPRIGEPRNFVDEFEHDWSSGGAYALISHLPGALGKGDVLFFGSRHSAGREAAVQWLSDPTHARMLFEKMKSPTGKIPRYYQVLLKAKFKNGTLVDTSYVLHRELTATPKE